MNELDRQLWIALCAECIAELRPEMEFRQVFDVAQGLWPSGRSRAPATAAEELSATWANGTPVDGQ